jgi:hypothetical protein
MLRRWIRGWYFTRLLQLLKFIIADLRLSNQDAAAKTLNQVAADRAEPPSCQRPLRAMTNDDKVCSDFFCELYNFCPASPVSNLEVGEKPNALSRSTPSARTAL